MKAAKIGIISLLALLLTWALAGCGAKDPVIKVGNDQIPSLYSVVGERRMSGSAAGFDDSVRYVTKTYAPGEVSLTDIEGYWTALRDQEHFIVTMDTEQLNGHVKLQLGKESVDNGAIVLIDIDFDELGNTEIQYRVGEGTLTRYDE